MRRVLEGHVLYTQVYVDLLGEACHGDFFFFFLYPGKGAHTQVVEGTQLPTAALMPFERYP